MVVTKTRRTQEERRAQTRAKLLDATIQSLTEVGYAQTTTRAVAQRAGVSSGAQTHHFPRRVDLVAAAVEQLTVQRVRAMRDAAAGLPAEPETRARAFLDLLWADFSAPLFAVVVKLWVAAAEDADLYERLVPLERMLARTVAEAIAEMADDFAHPDLEARVATVLAAIRGMALSRAFEPRRGRRGDQWKLVRPVLERVLVSA